MMSEQNSLGELCPDARTRLQEILDLLDAQAEDQGPVALIVIERIEELQEALHASESVQGTANVVGLAKRLLVCLRASAQVFRHEYVSRWVVDGFDAAHRMLWKALENDTRWRAELVCRPIWTISAVEGLAEVCQSVLERDLQGLQDTVSASVASPVFEPSSQAGILAGGFEFTYAWDIPSAGDVPRFSQGNPGLLNALQDPFQEAALRRLYGMPPNEHHKDKDEHRDESSEATYPEQAHDGVE